METASWQIRTISPREVDVFRQIRLEALKSEPGAFASVYEDWVRLSDAEWRERMNIPIFVAFSERRPVGLVALKQLQQPKMMHRATLTMVYVNKSFRGSGLASALLNTTKRYAEENGIRQIELGARADRAAAIRFYQRAGFNEIGTVPQGYLEDGLEFDEILMVKRLDARTCFQSLSPKVDQRCVDHKPDDFIALDRSRSACRNRLMIAGLCSTASRR